MRDFPSCPVVKTSCTSSAGGTESISGWETKSTHAVRHGQKKKEQKTKEMRIVQGILQRDFISCWPKAGNVTFQLQKAQISC